jgi:hypothetical protein
MSAGFIDLLPENHREALKLVSKVLGQDARLSGGTALMLQIGHRCSHDLDFFCLIRARLLHREHAPESIGVVYEAHPCIIRPNGKR